MTEKIHTLELTTEELILLSGFFAHSFTESNLYSFVEVGSVGGEEYHTFLENKKEELSYSEYTQIHDNIKRVDSILAKLKLAREVEK